MKATVPARAREPTQEPRHARPTTGPPRHTERTYNPIKPRKDMKTKRSQKETTVLRELVGEDGTRPHFFQPQTVDREAREKLNAKRRRAAAQLAEMREKAGEKRKKPATQGAAAQLAEMRKEAATGEVLDGMS